MAASEAPGSIAGLLQINAVIPANTSSGPQAVVLQIGAYSNDLQTVTVAVQ
jgi:uncharacterized protein (TIGR03437 family)